MSRVASDVITGMSVTQSVRVGYIATQTSENRESRENTAA